MQIIASYFNPLLIWFVIFSKWTKSESYIFQFIILQIATIQHTIKYFYDLRWKMRWQVVSLTLTTRFLVLRCRVLVRIAHEADNICATVCLRECACIYFTEPPIIHFYDGLPIFARKSLPQPTKKKRLRMRLWFNPSNCTNNNYFVRDKNDIQRSQKKTRENRNTSTIRSETEPPTKSKITPINNERKRARESAWK